MAQIRFSATCKITDDRGKVREWTYENLFTSLTEPSVRLIRVATSTTLTVWNPTVDTSEQVGDFDFLGMVTDLVLYVEATVNEGHANEELGSFPLAANTFLAFGADDAYYNHSASDVYAGTLDVIDKLRVRNPSASTVANLLLILAT